MPKQRQAYTVGLLGLLTWGSALGGCVGTISAASDPDDEGPVGRATPGGTPRASPMPGGQTATPAPGAAALPPGGLRRPSPRQLERALADLLPGVTLPASLVPEVAGESPFSSVRSEGGLLGPSDVVTYNDAVDELLAAYFQGKDRVMGLLGCAPGTAEEPCVAEFVRRFGRRALRRALSKEEVDRYLGVIRSAARDTGSVATGIELGVAALLESPSFFYLVELGEPDPGHSDAGSLCLTAFETATRLGFSLWQTTPDAALLDAAAAGDLLDAAGLRRHVERMLRDPRAKVGVATLFREYLALDDLAGLQRDKALYPRADPALFRSMAVELERLVEELAATPGRSVMGLFDTRVAYVDRALGALYGVTVPDAGAVHRVELPEGDRRRGLLTRAGFLAPRSTPQSSSPTQRGVFVFREVLCEPMPGEVPANVEQVLERLREENQGKPFTERELRELHGQLPGCKSCHELFDPLGFALENFDAIGGFRATEKGRPIDASGKVVMARDPSLAFAPVDGPAALGRLLARDERVAACLARQAYRFATGHLEDARELLEVLPAIGKQFERSGYDFTALLSSIYASEGFVRVGPPQ